MESDPSALGSRGIIDGILRQHTQTIDAMLSSASACARPVIETVNCRISSALRTIASHIVSGTFYLNASMRCNSLDPPPLLPDRPGDLKLLTLVGTFDPPRLDHVCLLLEAMVHVSEHPSTVASTYAAFLCPLGDQAPSPKGEVWKPNKSAATDRHNMCRLLTIPFEPLVRTSLVSLQSPGLFGVESALQLMVLNADHRRKTDFLLVCGSDTFGRWSQNFDEYLQRYKQRYPAVPMKIIVKPSTGHPICNDQLEHLSVPVVILDDPWDGERRSSEIRMSGAYDLLTPEVRAYLEVRNLYDASE